ncbi:MAG: LD-carboxypeptidase [Candidatus Aminicenantales bacterium]|jgi:muramoyltetrapeptide carboxypeptidase LdcA involved in peptidoglycan recycling
MSDKTLQKVGFIAPSTCLPRNAKSTLNRTASLIKRGLGVKEIYYSPFLFSMDEQIDHVTASADERSEDFKTVIRDYDLIVSVAGGTGAEDLAFKIDKIDYRVIRNRRPIFIGFSDFTFLLSEIYHHARVPVVYFPTLKLSKGNSRKIFPLILGEDIHYQGQRWLTPPPARRISGIPIGGNLTTFVNFLNREKPPKFSWRRHILFFEDIQIDVEDLHRLLAALRRHNVLGKIRGIVIGSMAQYPKNHNYQKNQREALKFILTYLRDVIRIRRKQGYPLPILSVSNFGHNITRDLMAVPMGGKVTISKNKKITFRLGK